MEIISTSEELTGGPIASDLIDFLESKAKDLELTEAKLYVDFPIYRDDDFNLFIARLLLASPNVGIICIWTSEIKSIKQEQETYQKEFDDAEQIYYNLYSRLIRKIDLRRDLGNISSIMDSILYLPLLEDQKLIGENGIRIIKSIDELYQYLDERRKKEAYLIEDKTFNEVIAFIEGSTVLVKPKIRKIKKREPPSKGYIVKRLETEIARFDIKQKRSNLADVNGPQRIRGLAGSGKTVILAMKTALTHLKEPDAIIVFTYYTKSLHQLVRNLIRMFYRQYIDQDPDWSKVFIMHAWGGFRVRGVYYDICKVNNIKPLNFTQASRRAKYLRIDPFDFVCSELIKNEKIRKIYDYVFIDEGQDFSVSFIRLIAKVTKNYRFVWAYDDLQTIFQASPPTPIEIFGANKNNRPSYDIDSDIVLYKCYRNPREILVCAHALGFGIYGEQIVQMIDNKEYWGDIGYKYVSGEFKFGSDIIIERPEENSLTIISQMSGSEEIVKVESYDSIEDEINEVVDQIVTNINEDELRPDDVLVIVVDDFHARNYLEKIESTLAMKGIKSNNIHDDNFGLKDFSKTDSVTLSTVYKAKGNEAYFVYIVGVDAIFIPSPDIQKRNILFSAITRAKGWVRISGIGKAAEACEEEVHAAMANFPYLKFNYPDPEMLKIMKRDLEKDAIEKMKSIKKLEKVMEILTPEEIKRYLDQKQMKFNRKNEEV